MLNCGKLLAQWQHHLLEALDHSVL